MQDWIGFNAKTLRNDNDSCIVVIVVAIHCIFARNTRARSGPGHPARRKILIILVSRTGGCNAQSRTTTTHSDI